MKEYMLIFRLRQADHINPQKDAAGWQEEMSKWRKWMDNLISQGLFKSSSPLNPHTGKIITGPKKVQTDGPFTEGKEIVGGYMLIYANDLSHASEISYDCPLLSRGGIVEVREVIPGAN